MSGLSDEESVTSKLHLPGDRTQEEARLEKKGCLKSLRRYRHNVYKEEQQASKQGKADFDSFVEFLQVEH
ncbi:hypothetical protein N7509_006418 [Penicillium cosmopolitanum]|uniref:Uncharacterized protein n=1 Tax=Penicillium cosmopolitanum TaxID=1131564 RepID=A0A9W9W486_9EURO|nr:uncharacterized protein N7509_006418 [Penicillium cosmopolitanum]KAJ5398305.1 hypothetical protein N7509_006418 [Penicillium cosmopolitanum]